MDKLYDFKEAERQSNALWQKHHCFDSFYSSAGKKQSDTAAPPPYSMVIPPPNVTGRLHMGHALNNTIQDLLVRFYRLKGFDVLWVPGTDHAGIATQTVVKKKLDAEGIDYRRLGREKFIESVFAWKKKYGGLIIKQLKALGASCDWRRERFTMDPGLARAVNYVFKRLYDDGLIYKGERLVNWCPVDQTALSDDEVVVEEEGEPGFLWQLAYPLAHNPSQRLVVSTTRPETLFGDVAVAVHPADERYRTFIGQKVLLPLTETSAVGAKAIPVIADSYVDRTLGTGCLKITPAHDPNDFEIAQRHQLSVLNIMEKDARLNEAVPPAYRGLSREAARERVLQDLRQRKLLVGRTEKRIPRGRSYRSGVVIEYRLSQQWFVKTRPLAEKVLAQRDQLQIFPARFEAVFDYWLNNLKDWCISRQIWWGHPIPAWQHRETGALLVADQPPPAVLKAPALWKKESDVLDTWFSSALWPLSVFGWPDKTPDFERYFPTNTLSTAKDIIFFWVARMCLFSVYFEGKMPFKKVYFHSTVLDDRGKVMSKSKGNGIDPLHIINGATLEALKAPILEARPPNSAQLLNALEKKHHAGFPALGADALRYTLIYLCSNQQALKLSLSDFLQLGRRFTTKLWNAARFTLQQLQQKESSPPVQWRQVPKKFEFAESWILASTYKAARQLEDQLSALEFTTLGALYYNLVWNDFCDWYLEIAKLTLTSPKTPTPQRQAVLFTLHQVLRTLLIVLHPLLPYLTETLWGRLLALTPSVPYTPLMRSAYVDPAAFPAAAAKAVADYGGEKKLFAAFALLQRVVSASRALRKQHKISEKLPLVMHYFSPTEETRTLLETHHALFAGLLKASRLQPLSAPLPQDQQNSNQVSLVEGALTLYLQLPVAIKSNQEKKRLEKKMQQLLRQQQQLSKRLANPLFLARANPPFVAKEKEKEKQLALSVAAVRQALSRL